MTALHREGVQRSLRYRQASSMGKGHCVTNVNGGEKFDRCCVLGGYGSCTSFSILNVHSAFAECFASSSCRTAYETGPLYCIVAFTSRVSAVLTRHLVLFITISCSFHVPSIQNRKNSLIAHVQLGRLLLLKSCSATSLCTPGISLILAMYPPCKQIQICAYDSYTVKTSRCSRKKVEIGVGLGGLIVIIRSW